MALRNDIRAAAGNDADVDRTVPDTPIAETDKSAARLQIKAAFEYRDDFRL